ncbi:MAG: carbon-nitrogen hydrolase family protein [Gammaproteobacteria bacterium]|jgi:nitrilase
MSTGDVGPSGPCRIAALQMVSGPHVEANLETASALLEEAAAAGARLAVLPENFACMPIREADRIEIAEPEGQGPIQTFLASRARELSLWIIGGTLPLRDTGALPFSASLVYDADGELKARYDKIYLFDVSLPSGSERYAESAFAAPGRAPVVLDSPAGRLGLSVCYDVRFPELFRGMLDRGLQTIALPAAFTAVTGRAHWETLLRARAIENLSWVIAAAQGGRHANGRETWGASMVVDPWGKIVDRLDKGPGVVIADIDFHRQREIRRTFPALDHRLSPTRFEEH